MKKIKIDIKFKGIDSWNRPVFKSQNSEKYSGWFFGSVQTLFPDRIIAPNNTNEEIVRYFKEHISELEFFGVSFDCEPLGGLASHVELHIID